METVIGKTEYDAVGSDLMQQIEGSVGAIAQLHAEHHQQASSIERWIDRATAALGMPSSLGILSLTVCLWVGMSLMLLLIGVAPFDPPPFPWLASGLALASVYMSILILATQRRADKLASRREHLTLELALISEHKAAKIIRLLEELRLDSPNVRNRIDIEADAMATPADACAVLGAIKGIREEMLAAEST